MKYKDEKRYDEYGRLVYESRSDGFVEETVYDEGGNICEVRTRYPNGAFEVEHYKT